MNKFNIGDEIERECMDARWAWIGFKAVVLKGNLYLDALGEINEIIDEYWELVKPKWSIYNNTLPWSQLSDKQKGKLLLANHSGIEIKGGQFLSLKQPVKFDHPNFHYFAVKSEPVKPEPTMTQLFVKDWNEVCDNTISGADRMIARGWNKPC
jgi:hypothetical protein